jgi:hypothetical protein
LTPIYAINWENYISPNHKEYSIDIDSIKEYRNYIFFNLKVKNVYTKEMNVITLQCMRHASVCARIKYYTMEEYNNSKGEYENITDNMTRSLSPVEYGSVAHSSFTKAKQIMDKDKVQIKF